ncbi:hypothetical protein HPB52_005286 [Rhipicephalus sanguineus]|uniref:Uncharacterized protein n=2 Tax=Rhipicephalus sanguineus TaxID=34632 RepID=A0A9D4PUD9_RHISA|nr:hypothetical protein HPB52_005286 [Rhipicephalus sanguineus]
MGVISQDCDDGQYRIDVDYGGSPEEYTCTMKDLLCEGHRPLWPVYGEYKYVPPQRWLHSIEHGAVVMLYHPCAPAWFVEKLRKLVRDCLRKHIITPHRRLSLERPLALVAWGCKLQMSHVNAREVIKFIKEHALRGPEGRFPMEGQYSYMLIAKAHPPSGSDMNDANLCPALHEYTRLQTTF